METLLKCYKGMAVSVLTWYSNENSAINRTDKRKIEPAEIRFLRPSHAQ